MYLGVKGFSQQPKQGGLALIEVLLALALSSVMFLVLFTAQSYSLNTLIYAQQLRYANQLLYQVASQVWAYPKHYQALLHGSSETDLGCLNGRYCTPETMARAWSTQWQNEIQQRLPSGELSLLCPRGCGPNSQLFIELRWSQKLAADSKQCPEDLACVKLHLAL
ncbi:MAG: prepilin-type N-terminal cleavage/methylation domain-containing protein [Gammaproteobacteria bacterium]|nr:prepilin-type N-terminal cleavage/methylation domain-containing protein [Gammaproteobacteria bacterium]